MSLAIVSLHEVLSPLRNRSILRSVPDQRRRQRLCRARTRAKADFRYRTAASIKQRYGRWPAVAAESSELRVSRDIFAMQERLPAGVEYQKANRARRWKGDRRILQPCLRPLYRIEKRIGDGNPLVNGLIVMTAGDVVDDVHLTRSAPVPSAYFTGWA